MLHGLDQQKAAVQSAYWPLFRYNPALAAAGKNPFQLDSRPPAMPFEQYAYNEGRYTQLQRAHPETAALLLAEAQHDVNLRWKLYEQFAAMPGATV
jgi:pyruvate-ferredoxin/flavodoxin oxidoreductase